MGLDSHGTTGLALDDEVSYMRSSPIKWVAVRAASCIPVNVQASRESTAARTLLLNSGCYSEIDHLH